MKVKICGVCRAVDASSIHAAGADYIGVILARRGPRQQTIESAMTIFDAANDLLRVGVFANQKIGEVAMAADALQLDVVQLHGAEDSAFINELECVTAAALWKSICLKSSGDLARAVDDFGDHVDGLLLDAASGGSGQRFDWNLATQAHEMLPRGVELIVAGGLKPENVGDVVALLKPDIVDVASGVEAAVCEKSQDRIQAFVRNAKS